MPLQTWGAEFTPELWDKTPHLKRFERRFFPNDYVYQPESRVFAEWVTNGGHVVAFAVGELAILGSKRVGYITRTAVAKAHRGKGMNKQLVIALVNRFKYAGVHNVMTYTVVSNVTSLNSLLGCGFKPYWPTSEWAGPGVVYLRYKLC